MGEPTNSSTGVLLEHRALGIQEVEVILLLAHAGDSGGRGRTRRAGLHRGPTIFGEDDLFSISLGVDPVQIFLDETPGSASSGGLGAKEW